ncbi:hypothetical protein L1077_21780 [Pseudoalteromonas luteoviolacea]|uniref:hypothetical protein n=1 Tax=Pseudoalteromonas luteoviolacea TaxID=43657 RepID=UPI001F329D9B|nr:hypothetical protein [Pseudoalteromonas luteoviolacea]MCF6442063.1 hypothetical protein [Pseudoalteromonas luteoviolacea]
MSKATTLEQLKNRHGIQAAAIVTKQLNNINWKINPNDVGWLYHYPQIAKQPGRSARVYHRLNNLNHID